MKKILINISMFSLLGTLGGLVLDALISPKTHVNAQLQNIWYLPAQFIPFSSTDISTLTGAVNIPVNKGLHVCEFSVWASTSGSAATLTVTDRQSTAIKYFDAVTLVSSSAGSHVLLNQAAGPEGCEYYAGGIKINASAGSQLYFTMKGYY